MITSISVRGEFMISVSLENRSDSGIPVTCVVVGVLRPVTYRAEGKSDGKRDQLRQPVFKEYLANDMLEKQGEWAFAVTLALWLGVTGLSTPTTTRLTGIPLSLRF